MAIATDNSVRIELWNLVVPLAEVLEASAGPRQRTAHVLMAFMQGAGKRGIGYSIFREKNDLDLATKSAQVLVPEVRPDMAARNSNFTGYSNGNEPSRPLIDRFWTRDQNLFPLPEAQGNKF